MASHLIPAAALVACLVLSASAAPSSGKKDVATAVEEMRKANYFSFVMLINMAREKVQGNITFLMPGDQALSQSPPPQDGVLEFLARHSIASPLLFEELMPLPDGTLIPATQPDYMIGVSGGGGRERLYLNGVELVRPNVCVAGTSVRCHGIAGVLAAGSTPPGGNSTAPACPRGGPQPPGPGSAAQWQGAGGVVLPYAGILATLTSLILVLS